MISDDFVKNLFAGPKKVKPIAPPAVDNAQTQDAAARAMRMAGYARGRGATNFVGDGLGSVG